jgi:mRNA interferase MazF
MMRPIVTSEASPYQRWDVLVAPFPFTDLDKSKRRPVLVLSSAEFNQDHRHVIAAMITTGSGSHWPTDHKIIDLAPTGLTHSSVVRWKMVTLDYDVIIRRCGVLSAADRGLLAARMAGILLG